MEPQGTLFAKIQFISPDFKKPAAKLQRQKGLEKRKNFTRPSEVNNNFKAALRLLLRGGGADRKTSSQQLNSSTTSFNSTLKSESTLTSATSRQYSTDSGFASAPTVPPRKSADAQLPISVQPLSLNAPKAPHAASTSDISTSSKSASHTALDPATEQYVRSNFSIGGANQPVDEFQLPEASLSAGMSASSKTVSSNRPLIPEASFPLAAAAHSKPLQNVIQELQTNQQNKPTSNAKKLGRLHDGQSTFLTMKDFRFVQLS